MFFNSASVVFSVVSPPTVTKSYVDVTQALQLRDQYDADEGYSVTLGDFTNDGFADAVVIGFTGYAQILVRTVVLNKAV